MSFRDHVKHVKLLHGLGCNTGDGGNPAPPSVYYVLGITLQERSWMLIGCPKSGVALKDLFLLNGVALRQALDLRSWVEDPGLN